VELAFPHILTAEEPIQRATVLPWDNRRQTEISVLADSISSAGKRLFRGSPTLDLVQKNFHFVGALECAKAVFKRFRSKDFIGRRILRHFHVNPALHAVERVLLIVSHDLPRFGGTSYDLGATMLGDEHLAVSAGFAQLLFELPQRLTQVVSLMLLVFGLGRKPGG
jgi:hypothetical protein